MNRFGERLRELRLEKSLTQTQLAKILNVKYTAIGKWELRQREPNIDTILFLCKYFNVSADYLLGLED